MAHYPAFINDEYAIAEYISELSANEVCEESIREFFIGASFELVQVKIADLRHGNEDHNLPDPKKEARYAKQAAQTRPPIVVDFNLEVSDGNHRYRDAIKRGETLIWAYIPSETLRERSIQIVQRAPGNGLTLIAPKPRRQPTNTGLGMN